MSKFIFKYAYSALLINLLVLTGGCATLQTDFKEPFVSVTSFRALPSVGMAPRFEIGLQVTNPNRFSLALAGLSYSVSLEGRQILNGVASDLPALQPYSEENITLLATADLFYSISLLADLIRQPRDTFAYELEALLDLGGIYPNINVGKKGQISLAPMRN